MNEPKVTLFKATIQGRVAVKKNGREFRRKGAFGYTAPSSKYREWEGSAAPGLLRSKRLFAHHLPICEPMNAKMVFYFKDRRHPDLSNSYQGVEDLLQDLGIIENDKLIHSHDGSRIRVQRDCQERVEITLTPFED